MRMVLILSKNVDFGLSYDVLKFACRIGNLFWTNQVKIFNRQYWKTDSTGKIVVFPVIYAIRKVLIKDRQVIK